MARSDHDVAVKESSIMTSGTRDDSLFSLEDAGRIANETFGVEGTAEPLPGYEDFNFRLRGLDGTPFVLKISHEGESREILDFQNEVMKRLAGRLAVGTCPGVMKTVDGREIAEVAGRTGSKHLARLLSFLPGRFLVDAGPHSDELLKNLGRFYGRVDAALEGLTHPAMCRPIVWDLRGASGSRRFLPLIADHAERALVERFLDLFEQGALPMLGRLRTGVIHNDGNDYNILVDQDDVTGIIDFGDALCTALVCEPAIVAAYAALGKDDPIGAASLVLAGFHEAFPLVEEEVDIFFLLVAARLCTSVCLSTYLHSLDRRNEYLLVSREPARDLLWKLSALDPDRVRRIFREACGMAPLSPARQAPLPRDEITALRKRHLGPSLSLSYDEPLEIVRGFRQYLYDEKGHAYLDAVNNVPHVGHCHPRVVRAAQEQIARLNTNTRYLHDTIVRYARRLCALLPDPLDVCFFVNSGSEANDLACRLARTCTGGTDMVVVDGAYHGNLSSLIDISPYKFNGPGGRGAPPHVRMIPMPDPYRGLYRATGRETGEKYAAHVGHAVEAIGRSGRRLAAFICEPLLGCGGQIVPPPGFLQSAARRTREAGGLFIADEVQVGFGRVGTHFWAFETDDVVPDIVTLGKPIGGGHPMAAVITTPEIAASFLTGMEYFNTFGGNPVSCAVGMAVLDVIEEERLQRNALEVGGYLKQRLAALGTRHPLVGDVRGLGLFLGVELVKDRQNLEPAAHEAARAVERMKEEGILLSTDGPLNNVIKIKPPLVFTRENADLLADTLDTVLGEACGEG